MSDDFLAKLNPEQHASVVTTEGAFESWRRGTGKTARFDVTLLFT